MAKITYKTRTKGTIQTEQGTMEIVIKKAFSGALNYTVYIDGVAKFQDLEISGAKSLLEDYVRYWK